MSIQALELRPAEAFGTPSTPLRDRGVRVVTAIHLVVAALLTGMLGRIPVFSSDVKEAPLFLTDVVLMLALLMGVVAAVRKGRLLVDRPAMAALAFVAVGFFSTAMAIPRFGLSPLEFAFSLAYLVRWATYFGLYLVVINYLRREDVTSLWGTVEKVLLAFTGFGLFQAAFLPDFAQIVYPEAELYAEWDPQGHRLVSTWLDPNFAGAFIAIGLLIYLGKLSYGEKVAFWKVGILLLGLACTVSRSSFLALFVGLAALAYARGLSRRLLKVGAALFLLGLPIAPFAIWFAASYNKFSIDPSAFSRVLSWLMAFEMIADHPIVGIGFNTFGFVKAQYGDERWGNSAFAIDGGLLFITVLTGFLGLAMFVAMLVLVVRRCRTMWKDESRPAGERGFAIGVAAGTAALVAHGIFLNSLLYPFLMQLMWVLWGMTFALRGSAEGTTRARPAWRLLAQPLASRGEVTMAAAPGRP